MSNYANLKADIRAVIKQNGNQEITGNLLQQSLIAMIESLGNGYLYRGIATPSTSPGTPDQNVFYLASTVGIYPNFGGATVNDGEVALLKYNGTWNKDTTGIASLQKVNQIEQEMKDYVGQYEGLLNVVINQAHSSNADRILVNIPEGTKFSVSVTNGTGSMTTTANIILFAKYGESSALVNIGSTKLNEINIFTAQGDISSIGFYIEAQEISSSGNLIVEIESGITKDVVDLKKDVADLKGEVQEIADSLTVYAPMHIVLGGLYHGARATVTAYSGCLLSDSFIEVKPNTTYKIQRANDINIRISEYTTDDTSGYVREVGYAAIDSLTTGGTTKYLRISGIYTARGYDASNPVAVSDYRDGDFAIIYTIAEKFAAVDEEIEAIVAGIIENDNIVAKNKAQLARIKAASKTKVVGYGAAALPKNYMFVIATDIHNNLKCLTNAIDLADGVNFIDSVINLGDQQNSYYNPTDLPSIQAAVAYGQKPKFVILGNHDVGNTKKIRYSCNHNQAYAAYIKPMIDAGYLAVGEYQANKSYYYHDLATQKIRIIFLNDFDETIEVADSDYWEPVPYDSTKPLMTDNTSYNVGDIVNCGTYTASSFRCKAQCTSGTASNASSMQEPLYKLLRGRRAIQHDQAQWFLDTLLSTPQNYSVIVASHCVFSQNVTAMTSAKFCQSQPFLPSIGGDVMITDLIAMAIDAFINGENFSINVAFSSEGQYMNTQGGGTYAYTVSKNFAGKNSGVKFIGYINGHYHQDIIRQHNTYADQKSICPTTSSPTAGVIQNTDLYRTTDIFDTNYDALTVIGVDTANSKFCLVRIGADISTDMYVRDVEKL